MAAHKFEKTQIKDLNCDCLEVIFNHLEELNDLLNVVDSSTWFYEAACRTYKRKYVNMNPVFCDVNLFNGGFMNLSTDVETEDASEIDSGIFLDEPIMLFRLLRNFGHMIKNLTIDFSAVNVSVSVEIEKYLEKYCCDSLQRFALMSNTSKFPFENLQKPFANVIALQIIAHPNHKGDSFQLLNETNLPNLKHILIASTNKHLWKSGEIHHENIEHFTIRFAGYRIERFPFYFGNLKHLNICGDYRITDAFCEWISKVENLETLKLMSIPIQDARKINQLLELPNIQSNLEEMHLQFIDKLSADDIIRFLKRSQKLRKLSIHRLKRQVTLMFRALIDMITSNLDASWIFKFENSYRNPLIGPFFECERYVFERKFDL